MCRRSFGSDADVRWMADNNRLVQLPDGCGAHRYCAVENPRRNAGLIIEHECPSADTDGERRRADRRAA
jgi:hypothetical protein